MDSQLLLQGAFTLDTPQWVQKLSKVVNESISVNFIYSEKVKKKSENLPTFSELTK